MCHNSLYLTMGHLGIVVKHLFIFINLIHYPEMIRIFKIYDNDILLSDIKNSLAKSKNLKSRSNVPKISFLQVFLTKTAYFCDYLQFKENKKMATAITSYSYS